ncbi:nucleotidyltransferase family protein [Hasllibacter sp. MH4015]|uniref:nucleotidyltransferase family protein n=1 Tax=Hasllibacter sp. MH4015 TaxID=2854029 RepID=UPI001CD42724|nr:nucleotidyltransferase family protein [Hasllibacter sp. MH4015]
MTLPCLILAAGFGTRMGALTAERPKPLIEVAGRTLLDHALAQAEAVCSPVAVNAHYRADQITTHLAGRDVRVMVEAPDILDSGGAVKRAASVFGGVPMATLNADTVWRGGKPLAQLSDAFDPGRMDALLLLIPRDRATGRIGGGDFAMDAQGRLTFDKSADSLVYTGAQILNPARALAESRDIFSLRDIWAAMQAEGRLFGLLYPGQWADVGHPDGIAAAEKMLGDGDV